MASYLPGIVTKPIAHGTDMLRGAIGGISWGPVLSLSKAAVTGLFGRIEKGSLIVIDETTGKTEGYGQRLAKEDRKMTNGINGQSKKSSVRKVELVVRKDSFWVRVFLFADMGFAEAFMLGEVECSDLTSFFEVQSRRSSWKYMTTP
jgi:cyclopropane-fatty-acyl-phospholipid synthase